MDKLQKLPGIELDPVARSGLLALEQQPVLDLLPEEVPHLLDYWQVVVKRRWIVLSCLLIVFATVAIGTFKQRSVYQGRVLIEINPEEPQVLNFREVVNQAAPTIEVDSYRETQYRILQSRALAEMVINDLKLYRYPEFYRRRAFLGMFEINPDKIPSGSDIDPPDPSAEAYRNTVKQFLGSVDVSPVRRSNLVEVSFDSYDPNLAARVANQLANDYIQQNLQVKWDETLKASEWLQGRLVDLKAKLEKAEDAVQAYARANSIVYVHESKDEKQNMAVARLEELLQEYTKAQAERFTKESLYSVVEAGKVQDLPAVLSNRLIQDLEVKLADAQKEYARITTWVKPDYPRALQVKKQIDALQAQIDKKKQAVLQNILDDYHAAVARESYLGKAVGDQKKEVNQIAEKSVQYNYLKREADTLKQLYEGLLTRMKEAQVSAGLKASNIRIVDTAEVPKSSLKPRVLLDLALGLILGLGLGLGVALFQEYLDDTLKTPDEVERLLRLPSLGVLPAFSNGAGKPGEEALASISPGEETSLAPAIQTNPAGTEAYRSLRTSILLSAHPVPRLILVTSALPFEGKTTTTVNLGATLASLGSRVVIVDCDMRKPACHRSTGVKNNPGFVQCLTGNVDLAGAILPVPGVASLSVLPCGPIPPNPAEILSSPVASELLRKLRAEFEYVLVDSPPLLSVADSRILATLTDAVVLVVRAHETPYDVVRRARSLLYGAGARILGVALNDVNISRDGYGYGGYYYHGYGYSQEPEDNVRSDRGKG